MVRLFSTTLIYMLAASYFVARRSSQNPRSVLQLALREASGEGNRDMERVFSHGMNLDEGPSTMFSVIAEALEAYQKSRPDDNDGSHGNVIDAIVEILGLPYAMNSLTPNRLSALRRILLFPNEVSTFLTTSGVQEMVCVGCKRLFTPGNMATFTRRETSSGAVSGFYCIHCLSPESVHCGCGTGSVEISGKTVDNLLNTPCPHKPSEKPAEEMYSSSGGESIDIETVSFPPPPGFTSRMNTVPPGRPSMSALEDAVRRSARAFTSPFAASSTSQMEISLSQPRMEQPSLRSSWDDAPITSSALGNPNE